MRDGEDVVDRYDAPLPADAEPYLRPKPTGRRIRAPSHESWHDLTENRWGGIDSVGIVGMSKWYVEQLQPEREQLRTTMRTAHSDHLLAQADWMLTITTSHATRRRNAKT